MQVAYGPVDDHDDVHDIATLALLPTETVEGGHRYEARLPLSRSGPFGYTIRVLPSHALLAGSGEMGLVTSA